ncbi:unnamed protein product [Lactuca saligna]|uniref:Uncharacterized protein n=1 Tax=Lactuca saligna TaxID=75948 RepID=A0AA35YPX6_LACSI|nr:unnamed protein product [Lactuca saligna]
MDEDVRRKAQSGGAASGPLLVSGHAEDRRKKKVAGGEVSFDRSRRGIVSGVQRGQRGGREKQRSCVLLIRYEVRSPGVASSNSIEDETLGGKDRGKRERLLLSLIKGGPFVLLLLRKEERRRRGGEKNEERMMMIFLLAIGVKKKKTVLVQ